MSTLGKKFYRRI